MKNRLSIKKGKLHAFSETGTEGVMCSILEDNKTGYDALVLIKQGDHLKIFREDNSIAFDGIINENHKVGWAEYPFNPGHGQPAALGYWIHWTQHGFDPDTWAEFFFKELRAELIQKGK